MSYAPALDAYAFDVAVSFASEDREFVGEIVRPAHGLERPRLL